MRSPKLGVFCYNVNKVPQAGLKALSGSWDRLK